MLVIASISKVLGIKVTMHCNDYRKSESEILGGKNDVLRDS